MCDCISSTDEMLAEHNTTLVTTLFGIPQRCAVSTAQLATGRGKKRAAIMIASFCPFCGEKYGSASPSAVLDVEEAAQ